MRLAFIACLEQGRLEDQTKLLCRSIRRFAGGFRDAPIHTFQPRPGPDLSPHTLEVLNTLGVIHHTEPVNLAYANYGYGNKIFVCAHAEALVAAEVLVFLDSDTLFTNEPTDLDLPPQYDAALRPAYSRALNSTGPGHPIDPYWMRLYQLCGLEKEPYVENELGGWVRAYFSAGLIAVRRSAGLFGQWKADFLRLVEAGHMPEASGLTRMDEIALVATMVRAFDRVRLLDGRYNYLIFRRADLLPPWREAALEHLVHIHYRSCFQTPNFLQTLHPQLDPASAVVWWLEPHLPLASPVDMLSP